jgi:hypothetical protein
MTIAKIANEVGPAATAAAYTTAIKGYRGPAFMTPGTLYCGYNALKENISVCGNAVSFATFEKNEWVNGGTVIDPEVKFTISK